MLYRLSYASTTMLRCITVHRWAPSGRTTPPLRTHGGALCTARARTCQARFMHDPLPNGSVAIRARIFRAISGMGGSREDLVEHFDRSLGGIDEPRVEDGRHDDDEIGEEHP